MSEATPRIRYVGLDVHKETITVAVAEQAGRPEAWASSLTIPRRCAGWFGNWVGRATGCSWPTRRGRRGMGFSAS
jgi:hypothetical protein